MPRGATPGAKVVDATITTARDSLGRIVGELAQVALELGGEIIR